MNKVITKLANDLTYHGALQCATNEIANATLKEKVTSKLKWIQKILSSHIDQSVIFLNTGNVFDLNQRTIDDLFKTKNDKMLQSPKKLKNSRTYTNYCEAAIIFEIVKQLKAMNIDSKMIGIIAPYALQVNLLRKLIEQHFDKDIEVNTVDQYQGRDKEVCYHLYIYILSLRIILQKKMFYVFFCFNRSLFIRALNRKILAKK